MPAAIFLGAGHGGADRGAISPDGKLKEADLALRLRDAIAEHLTARGLTVITDGKPGENRPLAASLALARAVEGPRVEIHFNSALMRGASGVEALSKSWRKTFAQRLCAAVAEATGLKLRGEQGYRPDNAGQHRKLAFCEIGGVVLEVCFLSNPDDMRAYLANEATVAANLADALERAAAGWEIPATPA
jgi:N-acetylmuramoyl-L-alanine amidase